MSARKTTAQFIEDAVKVHGERYDYSLVEYTNSEVKVKVLCSEHGVFKQRPADHLRKGSPNGCPSCSVLKVAGIRRLTTETFIQKAKLKHGDKYDYSKVVYTLSTAKVEITCPVHGVFKKHPNSHLYGQGCPKCGRVRIADSKRLAKEVFIDRAKKAHGNKFDYRLVQYQTTGDKVVIICPVHGQFHQVVNDHMRGIGCSKCSDVFKGDRNRLSNEEFINRAQVRHDGLYDYAKTNYRDSKSKVKIICSTHGVFLQSPGDHMNGAGCPKCNASKGEVRIGRFLKTTGLLFEIEKRFENCRNRYTLPFDFYIPSHNLLIEYDGEQHFKVIGHFGIESFRRTQKHDQIKTRYAERHNIRLLRIKYTEYDRIEEILSEALKLEYQPLQLSLFAA
jgi:Zn finger protein HypA/HybF involved in hydrogenase expression/very-short-patch-repair endonuclease